MVLKRFPLGTASETILKDFPKHFIVFATRFSEHNGVWNGRDGVQRRNFGTHILSITVYKGFPLGMGAPFVAYRYVEFNFDCEGDLLSGEGRLLDIKVTSLIDAI